MLFIRWIKNQEGRIVCTWIAPCTLVSNRACSSGKLPSAEMAADGEDYISTEERSRSDYLALTWINPRRRGQLLVAPLGQAHCCMQR